MFIIGCAYWEAYPRKTSWTVKNLILSISPMAERSEPSLFLKLGAAAQARVCGAAHRYSTSRARKSSYVTPKGCPSIDAGCRLTPPAAMACNSLCFCFSGEPLRPDEYGAEGGRGATYEKYATNRETFQLGMGDAPLRAPLQCLAGGFPVTFICCQWHMRYRALNHVAPGSEWENYLCCQGYLPACLCFQPGHCGEREFPRTCMCLEACLCPGLAVSSTRFLLMDMYHLAADECDNRICLLYTSPSPRD